LKAATPILAIALVAAPLLARAAEPVAPGAGTLLQQVQPVKPPAPSPGGTGLKIEQEGAAQLPPSVAFPVKAIQITGNTRFATEALHALVIDAEGQSLTLARLNELAARITDYYRRRGYPLARAIIPAQTIRDGQVRIEVIEARYGKIQLDNRSQVDGALLDATLAPLQGGQVIEQVPLDRSLLLLSDIPGMVPSATLKPGEAVGTSDLLVEAAPGPDATGNVSLDGYGNVYTGRARLGATVNFIEPLRHGDVLSVNGLSSGRRLNYGRIRYESWLSGQGTRMGGSYSALRYILGDAFAPLDAHGTARVGSVWMRHPLLRSPDVNLAGQIQYDRKQLRDHILAVDRDRHLDNWTASLSGDRRDGFLAGGISAWSIGWSSGRVGFDDATAEQDDAGSANTRGRFSKWTANLVRLQALSPTSSLYLAFSGQRTNGNLDASEKMVAGGPYTVRAYDIGVASGDEGVLGSAEIRIDLGAVEQGRVQFVGFIEAQHVTVNKRPWAAGTNQATLRGTGLGLDYLGSGHWTARATLAYPLGAAPELVASTASVRAWVEIVRGF